MSLYRQPGSDNWFISLSHGGRRVRRTTGTSDKREAQRQHDELAASLWKVKHHGKHLSDALLLWYNAKPRKGSTLRNLAQVRKDYPDRPLSQVTEESLVKVWGAKNPGTYNKLAGLVRSAMNLAHHAGWVASPPRIARRKEPDVEPRYLTDEEWKTLRSELPDHLVPLADFSIATGLRWANASGLTWDRVFLSKRLAWIPAGTAKAGKTIPVPLSAAALRALRAIPGERKGYVFTYKGKRIGSPKTAWNKAIVRAGVPWCTWHTLRHTWASWHAQAGTPLPILQQLGGWASMDMVQRYAHLSQSYVAKFSSNAKPIKAQRDRVKKVA